MIYRAVLNICDIKHTDNIHIGLSVNSQVYLSGGFLSSLQKLVHIKEQWYIEPEVLGTASVPVIFTLNYKISKNIFFFVSFN